MSLTEVLRDNLCRLAGGTQRTRRRPEPVAHAVRPSAMSRRLLACVLGLLAVASTSAGGVARAAARPALVTPGAAAHTAAAADLAAAALVRSLRFPTGSHWLGAASVRAQFGQTIELDRTAKLPRGVHIAGAAKLLLAHPPVGWRGSSGQGVISFEPKKPLPVDPYGVDGVTVALQAGAGRVIARVDVQLGWSLQRTAVEQLPATTSSVDIAWSAPGQLPADAQPFPAGELQVADGDVATLVRWLNSLPTVPPLAGAIACAYPMFFDSSPTFTFVTTAGAVVLRSASCSILQVTVNGKPQPSLQLSPHSAILAADGGPSVFVMTRLLQISEPPAARLP